MIKWFQTLLTGGLALTHPGQTADQAQHTLTTHQPSGFISKATVKWIDDVRMKYDISGLGIGIIGTPNHTGDDWKTEFLGFGHKDHDYRPYDVDTTFHIADNSKLFVAVAIGTLIDNGTRLPNGKILGYDTKIKDILPEFRLVDKYAEAHLDILDTLSMRSGIPRHIQAIALDDAAEHVRQLGRLRPSKEIRQRFQYQDHHYWVLAEVVRHLTSRPIGEYAEKMFVDLGLTATTVNHTAAVESGNLAGTYLRKGMIPDKCQMSGLEGDKPHPSCIGHPVPVEWFVEGDGLYIPGPIVSSFTDMLKWLKELLDPQIIPAHVIAKVSESVVTFGDRLPYDERGMPNYGMAQVIYNYRGHEIIQHVGVQPGAGSTILRVPALGIGIVLALNDMMVGASLLDPIVYRILDDMFGLEPIDWEHRYMDAFISPRPGTLTAPPAIARPDPRADTIVGIYHDQAYGYLNITRFDDAHLEISSEDLLAAYADIRPGLPKPEYIGLMSNIYSRGMLLTHFDGPLYNATHIVSRKEIGGEHFPILPHFHTAVTADGGVGMFENFWMAHEGKKAVEDAVEQEAEVWFAKVKT